MTIRLLLADDQPLLLHGFSMILNAQPDLEVVGVANDGAEAVRMAAGLAPDVVLMDVRMPGVDGLSATRQLTERPGGPKVLVLTTFDLDAYAVEAVQAGASGFLLKNARPEELLAGIRAVASGDAVLAPSTTRRMLHLLADRSGSAQSAVPTTTDADALVLPHLSGAGRLPRAGRRAQQHRDRTRAGPGGDHREDPRHADPGQAAAA